MRDARCCVRFLSVLSLVVAWSAFGVDDRAITVTNATLAAQMRNNLIADIWGASSLPTSKQPTSVTVLSSPPFAVANLERVERLSINESEHPNGLAYHFVPNLRKNRRLVVVHHGHACTFADGFSLADNGFGMQRTVSELLSEGYGVLAVFMPFQRDDDDPDDPDADDCLPNQHHTVFDNKPPNAPAFAPMRYFLEPTLVSLNYAQTLNLYAEFHMVGLSGGGWTTTLYAAVDPRIRSSFPVAGTMPLYIAPYGEREQIDAEFYEKYHYPDLYVLGSWGAGRKQVQILGRRDTCCFGEPHHPNNYTSSIREYELNVRLALFGFGPGQGSFRVEIDEAANGHMLSWHAAVAVILAELNGARRTIGAATTDHVLVRGGDTNLYRRSSGGSWDSPGFATSGTASVVQNAVNQLDVFYRDEANYLAHAAWNSSSGWSRELLSMPCDPPDQMQLCPARIGADPVAISTGPGTYDVLAFGKDYVLYHWRFAGGTPGPPLVVRAPSPSSPAPGLGVPAVTASPTGLEVFFRGSDRALYQSRWNGSAWTTANLGGAMKDFPSAVTSADGIVRVYLRGMSGQLWEAAGPAAGPWQWVSVSSLIAGLPLTMGTPAAIALPEGVKVYVRTPANNLATFTKTASWVYLNNGGGVTGSPTATPAGPLVRGNSAGLWLYNGTWTSLGGYID
jgi:hypothetical protein